MIIIVHRLFCIDDHLSEKENKDNNIRLKLIKSLHYNIIEYMFETVCNLIINIDLQLTQLFEQMHA